VVLNECVLSGLAYFKCAQINADQKKKHSRKPPESCPTCASSRAKGGVDVHLLLVRIDLSAFEISETRQNTFIQHHQHASANKSKASSVFGVGYESCSIVLGHVTFSFVFNCFRQRLALHQLRSDLAVMAGTQKQNHDCCRSLCTSRTGICARRGRVALTSRMWS
jgi:hypothetical protein